MELIATLAGGGAVGAARLFSVGEAGSAFGGPAGVDTAGKAIKSAIDVVGGVRKLLPANKSQELTAAEKALRELEESLTTAKADILALQKKNISLEQQVMELTKRLEHKEAATLREIAPRVHAYVKDDAEKTLKDGPWYCQPCFDAGQQAVFQLAKRDFGFDQFQCPRCNGQIHVPNDRRARILSGGRRRTADLDDFF